MRSHHFFHLPNDAPSPNRALKLTFGRRELCRPPQTGRRSPAASLFTFILTALEAPPWQCRWFGRRDRLLPIVQVLVRVSREENESTYRLVRLSQTSLIAFQQPCSPAPGPPSTSRLHQRLFWVNVCCRRSRSSAAKAPRDTAFKPAPMWFCCVKFVKVISSRCCSRNSQSRAFDLYYNWPSVLLRLTRLRHSLKIPVHLHSRSFFLWSGLPSALAALGNCSPYTHLSTPTVLFVTSLHPLGCGSTTLLS